MQGKIQSEMIFTHLNRKNEDNICQKLLSKIPASQQRHLTNVMGIKIHRLRILQVANTFAFSTPQINIKSRCYSYHVVIVHFYPLKIQILEKNCKERRKKQGLKSIKKIGNIKLSRRDSELTFSYFKISKLILIMEIEKLPKIKMEKRRKHKRKWKQGSMKKSTNYRRKLRKGQKYKPTPQRKKVTQWELAHQQKNTQKIISQRNKKRCGWPLGYLPKLEQPDRSQANLKELAQRWLTHIKFRVGKFSNGCHFQIPQIKNVSQSSKISQLKKTDQEVKKKLLEFNINVQQEYEGKSQDQNNMSLVNCETKFNLSAENSSGKQKNKGD